MTRPWLMESVRHSCYDFAIMKKTLLFAVVILFAVRVPAQRDFSKVEMKATKVAGNIYALYGAGGTIGVSAGPDGLLIVDDQFAPLADKIHASLKSINPGKLKFILNTHWHGDHVGGNEIFGAEAPIIAQTNVRNRMKTGQNIPDDVVKPAPAIALPVITFDQSLSVHFNGEEIRVIHYEHGHTDGDSVIYFTKSNVIHMGDLFFNGAFPFVDLDSGGDVEGYLRDVDAVIAVAPADAKIIAGHGPVGTVGDLKTYRRMISESIALVKASIEAKKTEEEIRKLEVPAEWKSWSTGFIKAPDWYGTIYKSLQRK